MSLVFSWLVEVLTSRMYSLELYTGSDTEKKQQVVHDHLVEIHIEYVIFCNDALFHVMSS